MMEYFVITVIFVAMLCGAIYALSWFLENVEFSSNPKVQHMWEIAVKVLRIILCSILAYVLLETAVILIAPLFERMNIAFNAAVTKIFKFFDQFVPYAVLVGIGWAWWKNRQPKTPNTADIAVAQDVEVEFARQRGLELQKFMLAFLYRIIVATRSTTNATPPNDEKGIAVISTSGMSFYMVGEVVVYQAIVPINEDITEKVEDIIQDELQDAVPKYVNEFPELIDNTRSGYPEVEILTVRGVGRKVIIDAVIASEKSIPLIKARRIARIERRDRQDREGDAGDPLFK